MKIIVILSGGLDSTVLLEKAVREEGADNVLALCFRYGQKHAKELECAHFQARKYGCSLREMNLEEVFAFDRSCSLLGHGDIPHQPYGDGPCSTKVPFRNGVMMAIATSVAESLGYDEVWIGAHEGDSEIVYPDCSYSFIQAFVLAAERGTRNSKGKGIEVRAPYIENGFTKTEIAMEALKHNVDYEHTWSCYEGGDKPCGTCGTCRQREEAFAQARELLNVRGFINPCVPHD